jgi:mycothiol synthase
MQYMIRPATLPDDFCRIAELLNAENPEWPVTAAELEREAALRDPRLQWAVFVAEEPGARGAVLAGVASCGHDPQAHREEKCMIDIRVRPELQGRGIGAALYRTMEDHSRANQARELHTDVWAAHPRSARFVVERGFVERWRRLDAYLDVAMFDSAPYSDLEAHLEAVGITVCSYAELADDPECIEKLHRLDAALWQDVPFGEPITVVSPARFEQECINNPRFIPEACFIAVHNAMFVGYSYLTRGDGYYLTEMTGVLPAYRGKGIAKLLKLRGIQYAQARANTQIRTVNDSINTPMLRLNLQLGFQHQGATIRFVKHLV